MCSFDFDELQMDARREYLMKGLKKRSKKKHRMDKNNQNKRKQQGKIHSKTKSNSANIVKSKTDSIDEPSGSNDKRKNGIENLHGNIQKEQDFNSFTKLCDFHNDNHKNHGLSYSNKKEKPLESKLDDHEAVNKDDDSSDLDHVCADLLQNNIEKIKTELSSSKEKSQKSNCIKPQRVTFGNIFKRNRKKCVKKKKSEDGTENEVIASTSAFKENRLSKGSISDKSEEETEDVVLYRNKNAESKYKSRTKQPEINESDGSVEKGSGKAESKYKSLRKQPEINKSDDSVEEDSGKAESKHKSRSKQPETNKSDGNVEEHRRNAESKHKSRRKQPEINESDDSVEEDSRHVESKHKSRSKRLEINESDKDVEDNKNAESKYKFRRKQHEINESDICEEGDSRKAESKHKSRRKQLEINKSDGSVEEDSGKAESRYKSRRKQPEINESDGSVEEDSGNTELKYKFRRKQPETNKSDGSVEEDRRNAESKHKSRSKQPETNKSDGSVEEDRRNAESKHKSRSKQSETNKSDGSVEADRRNAESKHKSRRKQLEINESDDGCVEDNRNTESKHKSRTKRPEINESDNNVEDTKNADSKYKSHRKQPEINESDMTVEDGENAESKYKSQRKLPEINESAIGKPRQKEKDYYDLNIKKKFGKCKCKKLKPKISLEFTRYLRESRRKRSRSNSLSKSNHRLSKPSSSFEYPKKTSDIKNLEYESPNSKLSLDCKAILAANEKKRKLKSISDLSCTCEEILSNRRKRERSRNSECERLLKKRKQKKIYPKKLLKTHKKKKISSACEKLLKEQEKSRSQSGSSRKKLLDKKKKYRSLECEKLLKPDRKKKSITICTSNLPRRRRSSLPRRRKSYHAPVLEDCGKELKKMNRALSNKIQQKESQLLGSCKKGKRKKKIKCKSEELQVPNCRCASSDLKDRYTKMIEDYHRLKRQYEALKCTNALIEKKLRCFMKKSKCKCTK